MQTIFVLENSKDIWDIIVVFTSIASALFTWLVFYQTYELFNKTNKENEFNRLEDYSYRFLDENIDRSSIHIKIDTELPLKSPHHNINEYEFVWDHYILHISKDEQWWRFYSINIMWHKRSDLSKEITYVDLSLNASNVDPKIYFRTKLQCYQYVLDSFHIKPILNWSIFN